MKNLKIEIVVFYDDEEKQRQMIKKESLSFESAQEALGKLERFIEKNTKND